MRVSSVLGVFVLLTSLYSGSAAFAGGYFPHGQGWHGQGSYGPPIEVMHVPTPHITTKFTQNNGMSQTATIHGANNEITQVGIQTNTNVQPPIIYGF
jgi:hypothetical protein